MRNLILGLIAAMALVLPFAGTVTSVSAAAPAGLCNGGTGIVSAYPASYGMTQARADMLCAMYGRNSRF